MNNPEETSISNDPYPEQDYVSAKEMPKEKSFRNKCLLIVFLNLVIISLLYVFYGKAIFDWLKEEMQVLIRADSLSSYLILMAIQIPFGTILFLPGFAYYNVLQAFLMQNMVLSFAVSFAGSFTVSMAVVIIIRKWFIDRIHKKFIHFEPYQMLIEETKEHPLRDGIIFNFVFIPPSVKNYLIGVSELKLWQAAVAFVPGTGTLCLFCSMVGSQLKDLSELYSSRSFSEKSFSEKLQLIFTWCLGILTGSVIIYIGLYYRKKYKAFIGRKREGEKREVEKVEE